MLEGYTHISCPIIEPVDGDKFKTSPQLNRARLRQSMLYFENVVYVPYASSFPFSFINLVEPEANLLIHQGVIQVFANRQIKIDALNPQFFKKDAENIFLHLNEGFPDNPFVSSVSISESAEIGVVNSIYCRLIDFLPVPHSAVSVGDIISFRQEHKDSLRRLGMHIEYLGVILENNLQNIEKVIFDLKNDLNRLSNEMDKSGLLGGRADFSFSRFLNSGLSSALAAGLSGFFGLNEMLASMIGATVEVSLKKGPCIQAENAFPRAFEYLIDAGNTRLFHKDSPTTEPDDWVGQDLDATLLNIKLELPPENTVFHAPSGKLHKITVI